MTFAALPAAEKAFPELEQILREAMEQSPRMVTQNLYRLRAEDDRLAYSAGLYPRVSTSATVFGQKEDRVDVAGTRDNVQTYYRFDVSQPLFHWGALRANAEIGRIQAEIAANNFVEAYRGLAVEIRRNFLQLILDKVALEHARLRLQVQERRLAVTEEQIRRGELYASALDRAVLGVDEARLGLDRTTAAFESSLRSFRRLTGEDDFDVANVPTRIEPLALDQPSETDPVHEAFLEEKVTAHNVFENALLELKSEELRYRITKVNQRPKVDFSTGINQDEVSYTANIGERYGAQRLFVGLSVSWNIFDGFSTRGRLLASGKQRRILENRLQELDEDLRTTANQSLRDLEFARRDLDLAERRFKLDFGGVSSARSQLERGQGSQSAVDDAQMADNAAELAVFRARANYLNAVTAFLSNHNADPIVNEAAARLESLRKR